MNKYKKIIIFTILISIILILSAILFYPKTSKILITGNNIDNGLIYNFIEKSYNKSKISIIDSSLDKKKRIPDLIIQPLTYNLLSTIELDESLFGTIPRSIARTGVINNKIISVPIFLDHVEVAFRSDIYSNNGLNIDDRILSLSDMENVLKQLVKPGYFPLVMAGYNDSELLDVISVLTLSLGGLDVYLNLITLLNSEDIPESFINYDLGDGWTLDLVIKKLNEWKDLGITHPQWYDFDSEKVKLYSERQITSTVIMRLSTHRLWPFHMLRRWQSSPFPFNNSIDAGSAIIAPPIMAYIPEKSRISEKTKLVLNDLMSKDFQEDVVKKLKLAPVHSSVDALDRESDDLRFWAAASTQVLNTLNKSAPEENIQAFVNEIRQIIVE